jgi:hypothetical protein
MFTRSAAARLGLRADRWVGTTLRGAGGLLERHANVDVGVATAGGAKLFQRQPGDGLSLPVISADLDGIDGLLGGDVLQHYVVDLDMPRARLALRTAFPAATIRSGAPLQPLRRNLLLVPTRLDGHALTALVDTGASASLINARGLYRLGLTPPLSAHDPTVPMFAVGGESNVRLHRFTNLQIGAFSVPKPMMLTQIVPEPAYDFILGLDVLGKQRIIISYPNMVLAFG